MSDSVAATQTEPPGEAVRPGQLAVARSSARATKLAEVSKGLDALASEATKPDAPIADAAAAPVVPVDPSKVEVKPEAAKAPDEKLDDTTARGLARIDREKKAFREEQARARADLELERADMARVRAEMQAKVSSLDELKKLRPHEVLNRLGYVSEDEIESAIRELVPHSKTGKTDPRNRAVADQTARDRDLMARIDAAERRAEAIEQELKTRDTKAQSQAFVDRYLDEAVKAIPATPTLIGALHAKNPSRARQALHEIGARLEREADNETPSHASVIAEYERMRRVELEEQGVDVDALLKPKGAPVTAPVQGKLATATLDVAAPAGGTRPVNGTPTRAERIGAVSKGLQQLWSEKA